jgi:hypothetical protein
MTPRAGVKTTLAMERAFQGSRSQAGAPFFAGFSATQILLLFSIRGFQLDWRLLFTGQRCHCPTLYQSRLPINVSILSIMVNDEVAWPSDFHCVIPTSDGRAHMLSILGRGLIRSLREQRREPWRAKRE